MRVSIVICTLNRCELLRRTLESLCFLVVPPGQEWEVLVVNNNSSDDTDEVLAAFATRLPLRRLEEPTLGISRARNTAVRAATGDLLLFTDDDIHLDPHWMTAFLNAAARWPDALYFGGIVRPCFAPDVPRWVRRHQQALTGMLCLLDLGPVERKLQMYEFPFGPNMAVRRRAFEQTGFDERVGRAGNQQIRGSETGFFLSLLRHNAAEANAASNVSGAWVPAAMVFHHIPASRASFRYLWEYYRGHGQGLVRLGVADELHSRAGLYVIGLKALVKTGLRPSDWLPNLTHFARMTGQYHESKRLALHRQTAQKS